MRSLLTIPAYLTRHFENLKKIIACTLFNDFLFIYMKLKNLGKEANYIPNYIYKKENTKGHSNIVSSNKRDPIQISYVVFGQLQV